MGRSQEAEQLYLRSLEILEELFGSEDPHLGYVLNNLGLVNANLGHPQRAVEFLERSLQIRLAALGEDHPEIAASQMNLGIAYFFANDLVRSDEQLTKARRNLLRSLEPRHPTFVDLEIAFGRLRRLQGRLPESLAHLDTAHSLALEVLGADHERTARALGLRGGTLLDMGRLREAQEALTRSLESYRRLQFDPLPEDLMEILEEVRKRLGE
jgi:tetratricopeptide (TPR) repeat protein